MKVKESCWIEEMNLEVSKTMMNQKKGMKVYLMAYQEVYLEVYLMAYLEVCLEVYLMECLIAYLMTREGIGLKRIVRKGTE